MSISIAVQIVSILKKPSKVPKQTSQGLWGRLRTRHASRSSTRLQKWPLFEPSKSFVILSIVCHSDRFAWALPALVAGPTSVWKFRVVCLFRVFHFLKGLIK